MTVTRRSLLLAALAAPALIRTPGLLMPVRKVPEPCALYVAMEQLEWIERRFVFTTFSIPISRCATVDVYASADGITFQPVDLLASEPPA